MTMAFSRLMFNPMKNPAPQGTGLGNGCLGAEETNGRSWPGMDDVDQSMDWS